ncbi:carbohydrate ABC transporter permease [Lapidilactobacillus bayanensis]|uniref:carbohydrate ABC transporter permease n=1 Tax=Lapidilactobacillus bayanensis TaxID=2485998 RepID=UPI000F7A4065|nr:sugar ABC transporter permease [Lapidilactobacillus bayanensis]
MQKRKNRMSHAFWMLIFPSGLLFFVFFIIPLILNIILSFTNYDGWKTMNFIGLSNYQEALTDSRFYSALLKTFIYAIVNLPFKVIIPLLLAVLLTSDKVKFKTFSRTAIYIPVLLSSLVVGITINWMFSQEYGLINFLIQQLGGQPVAWGRQPALATFIISLASTWASTGFYMIIYIGAINNISHDVYEAAEIDGVSAWQRLLKITIPLLMPTTFLVTLLSTVNLLKEYALIQGVTQGGPGTSTTFVIQYIFDKGFNQSLYGYAAAMSVVIMIIFAVIAFIQFKVNEGGEFTK